MVILSITCNHGWKTWAFANALKFAVVMNFIWEIFSKIKTPNSNTTIKIIPKNNCSYFFKRVLIRSLSQGTSNKRVFLFWMF